MSEKRIAFSQSVAKLVFHATGLGYGVAIAFVKRCKDCPVGRKRSCHHDCLAVDIDLYDSDLNYLTDPAHHEPLHDFWDTQDGASPRMEGDMNHYSYAHNGKR